MKSISLYWTTSLVAFVLIPHLVKHLYFYLLHASDIDTLGLGAETRGDLGMLWPPQKI